MPIASSARFHRRHLVPLTKCLQRLVFIALLASLLTACAAKRDRYDVPTPALPKQYAQTPSADDVADFRNNLSSPPASLAPVLASPFSTALAEWWRLLGSEELNILMDRALANNPDLRIATLRIAQSKARLDQAGADKLPSLSLPLSFGNGISSYGAKTMNQISLKGDWRPDIWGETASMYESAELQLLRATYQRDDMQRNIAANVTITYIEYLSLNDRLRVARETEKSLAEMLASVNARLKIGDATITEMEQQKAAIYAARSSIPVLSQQREIILNRLAALTGSMPVALKLSYNGLNSVRFPMVLPGVPSALLLRRPDVRAVESRLLAADADIDVARARILPPLDLTAQVGYGSMYMSQLFLPQALFWNTIANLSVSIFDGGKRAREIEFAQAVHEELLETYVRVIYDAVREVDDALSAINYTGKRQEAQNMAAESSLRAWNYNQETFMSGAVDYLSILDTQRTYQRNLDDLYNIRLERFRGLVDLFSALGGGVPSGDAMPGTGTRPLPLAEEIDFGSVLTENDTQQGKSGIGGNERPSVDASGHFMKSSHSLMFAARLSNRALTERLDWGGNSWDVHEKSWLVEITGIFDRGAILPAWRDLNARFPKQFENKVLLPHRQGLVTIGEKERSSWYRLYVSTFSEQKTAEEFCAVLHAGQQTCGVLPADAIKGKGEFVADPNSSPVPRTMAKSAPLQSAAPIATLSADTAAIRTAAPANTQPSLPLRLDLLMSLKTQEKQAPPAKNIAEKEKFNGLDWSSQQFWLVEIATEYEYHTIAAAWRYMLTRFPTQMKGRTILPRRQINTGTANKESPDSYKLFIARFHQQQEADAFCAILQSGNLGCTVVSSQSFAAQKTSGVIQDNSRRSMTGGNS